MIRGGDSNGKPLRVPDAERNEYGVEGLAAKPMITTTARACSNGPNLKASLGLDMTPRGSSGHSVAEVEEDGMGCSSVICIPGGGSGYFTLTSTRCERMGHCH